MDIKYFGNYSIGYENEGSRKKLIIELSLTSDAALYDYQIEMLAGNPSSGILPIELRRNDDKLKLIYDITGLITLQAHAAVSGLSSGELSGFFSSILDIIRDSKKLLLYEDGFLLDEDYIFFDGNSIKLVYIPVRTNMDFQYLFKDMVVKMLAKTGNELSEAALKEIIKRVKSPDFRISQLDTFFSVKNVINPTTNDEINKPDIHRIHQSNEKDQKKHLNPAIKNAKLKLIVLFEIFIISGSFLLYYALNKLSVEKETGYIAAAMLMVVGNLLLYKKTSSIKTKKEQSTILEVKIRNKPEKQAATKTIIEPKSTTAEETTLLKPENCSAYLMEMGKNSPEFIEVKGSSFIIGRSPSIADMVIQENSIGRIHAEIIKRDNDYYISDKSSKNGTYLNEMKLDAFEHKLQNNDLIIFANREYKFIADSLPG